MYDREPITLSRLRMLTKDELIAIILDQMAEENDKSIQNSLMYDLVRKYVDTNEDLKKTLLEVERLSNTDPLTGLYNRLNFTKVFDRELQRFNRYGQEFCIILMDIDHFKSVNDTYGHNIGDEVLKDVSKILTTQAREVDIVARWGGEEFIVLVTAGCSDGGCILAERIRKAIEGHEFPEVGQVTMSLGVAVIREGDTLSALTARADEALYFAKDSGRNQVVVYCHMIEEKEKGRLKG